MEKKTKFTKWGYEPVVLNTKAKAVFDEAFDDLKKHAKLSNKKVDMIVMRTAYDEHGDVHYELSFVMDFKQHEIVVTSVYDFKQSIFDFFVNNANN